MLLRMVRKILKQLKSRRGYTLVEAATVVVISGTLAIVIVPLASDKIEDSKLASASATGQAIATAMVRFFGDNKTWPAAKTFSDTGSEVTLAYQFLRSGKDANDNNLDPADDTGTWLLSDESPDGTITPNTTRVDNMNQHLVSDSPTVTNIPSRGTYTKAGFNWIGPYIPVVDQDPWGKNYIAHVRAMIEGRNTKGVRIYGWVISGGGNQRIETPTISSIITGDDVGTLVFSATRVEGVNDRTSSGFSAK